MLLKIFLWFNIVLCAFKCWALEPIINGIYRNRPAFSEASYNFAVATRQSEWEREAREKYSSGCPNSQKYVSSIFNRIVERNSLESMVNSPTGVGIVVMCRHEVNSTATRAGVIELAGGDLLLANSDDEIAYVIAHEMAHMLLGHDELIAGIGMNMKEVVEQADAAGLNLSTMEWEADDAGLILITRAGFDPIAAASMKSRSLIKAGACFGISGKCIHYNRAGSFDAFIERAERINATIKKEKLMSIPDTRSELFHAAQAELVGLK
jgi:predicted Zn-dependent protease